MITHNSLLGAEEEGGLEWHDRRNRRSKRLAIRMR